MSTARTVQEVAFLPEPYEGELLYSVLARYGAQMGYRTATGTFLDLVGFRQQSPNHGFPFHLDAMAARFPKRFGLSAKRLFEHHTLTPYYLSMASPEKRGAALGSARGGDGLVGRIVGNHAKPIVPVSQLRFCPRCLDDMDEAEQDLHWLRVHQLPIASHCVKHGTPLRLSDCQVATMNTRLHRATRRNCTEHASATVPDDALVDCAMLMEISKKAIDVLEGGTPSVDAVAGSDTAGISRSLTLEFLKRGFVVGADKLDWHSLEAAIAPIIAGITAVHPHAALAGRSHNGWLRHLLDVGRTVGTDAVVLALAILDRLPEIAPPFGHGPWNCVNPLADHFGEPVVTDSRLGRVGQGVIRGWFDCGCGCGYTLVRKPDGELGRPMIRHFGPLLEPFVLERSTAGWSIKRTATALGIDSIVLVRMVGDEALRHGWDQIAFNNRHASVRENRKP